MTYQSSVPKQWGKKGGLAKLEIVSSFFFFFFFFLFCSSEPYCHLSKANSDQGYWRPPLLWSFRPWSHWSNDCSRNVWFRRLSSGFVLSWFCMCCFFCILFDVWEMFIVGIIISANQTFSQLLKKTFCFLFLAGVHLWFKVSCSLACNRNDFLSEILSLQRQWVFCCRLLGQGFQLCLMPGSPLSYSIIAVIGTTLFWTEDYMMEREIWPLAFINLPEYFGLNYCCSYLIKWIK